ASLESWFKQPRATRYKKISVTPDLSGRIASLVLSGLESDAQSRRMGMDDGEFASLGTNIEEMLPQINRAIGSGNVSSFHEAVNQLLMWRGYQLEATDE